MSPKNKIMTVPFMILLGIFFIINLSVVVFVFFLCKP